MSEFKPPALSHPLTRDSWEEFAMHVQMHMQRGGQIPVRNLISSKVLVLLKLRLKAKKIDWSTVDSDQLVAYIAELCAPATKYEAKQKLRKVPFPTYLPGALSDAMSEYAADFASSVDSLPTAARLPVAVVVDMFISKLRPPGLKQSVELEVPTTLEEAINCVFEQLSVWS